MGSILVVVLGQSNARRRHACSWEPAPNLSVIEGDQKFLCPHDSQALGWLFGDLLARRYPDKEVCICTVAHGGLGIRHWLDDAAEPAMWPRTASEVARACEIAGVDQVSGLLWFQGEADAAARNFDWLKQFSQVHDRLAAQPWYGGKMLVFGISPHFTIHKIFNDHLLAAAEREDRQFVDLSALGVEMWEDELLHLTVQGQREAAKLAFDEWKGGRPQRKPEELFAAATTTVARLLVRQEDVRNYQDEARRLRAAIYEIQQAKKIAETRWVEISQHAERLQQELSAIRNSISYRITAPLRFLRGLTMRRTRRTLHER